MNHNRRLHPSSFILHPSLLAVLCCLAVGLASLRHTGSLAFPIDDGYIYSNYVLLASQGSFFTYNAGETSGGITGFAWYALCTLAYWLLAPFHSLLGGLGPPMVQGELELSRQAAHLYLAAYLPGALGLALAAVGTYRLANLVLLDSAQNAAWRGPFCWLAGAVAAADLGLVWGAMSGLEVSLSVALGVWAVYALLSEAGTGKLRWSLALAALLPLARPEMVVVALAGAVWLASRVLASQRGSERGSREIGKLLAYVVATGAGLVVMGAIYFVGWGRPLPSSFYAKVGGLRLGPEFFSAAQELVIAGRYLPFVVAGLAVAGGVFGVLRARQEEYSPQAKESRPRWAALMVLMVGMAYVAAVMLSLPWFGQEDRYLLPVHPFAIVLVANLLWVVLGSRLPLERMLLRDRAWLAVGGAVVVAGLLVLANYLWATRNYAVQVRNISDAHIAPAIWLRHNTADESLVASEPIGAVRLFSGRRTVDLVGLTSPATLGTYGDWNRAWPALRAVGADYLLFYPRWFDGRRAPGWAVTEESFEIPDNKIAGDSVIAVYRLDWSRFASR